jgi:H+-transporting ATPase
MLVFCCAVLAVGTFALRLRTPALQTLSFVSLVFGSEAMIYAIRGRPHLWSIRPSLWLAGSSLLDVAIAGILALAGIALAPLPAVVVAATLAAAGAFAVVLDLVKRPAFARLGIV